MTQESGEAEQHVNPPSFAPPAGRRTRPSGQIPSSSTSSQSPLPQYHLQRPISVPASFAPSAPRRSGSAGGPSGPAAVPPSFSPDTGRRQSSGSVSRTADPRNSAPTRARRSSGSSQNASQSASPALSANSRPRSDSQQRFAAITRPSAASAVVRPPTKRHRAGRIALYAVVIILSALALGVFGAWHWVDGRLNKTDYLTNHADTPASTWLILGSDERDGSSDVTGYRTDTILVLTKPKSGPSSLISIPRDSLMQVDDQYMKINAVSQLLGRTTLVAQVEDITGQKIDHVAQIKFGGLQQVVDALGGIDLCYDQDVQDPDSGLNWQAGCHHADGGVALAFSRMRYADANGDFGRNARQRQVIAAIIKKASSGATLSNPKTVMAVAEAGLSALTVDEQASPLSLIDMALAFKDSTGSHGISGSVYWTNPDYYVDGVGSSVLLDDEKNTALFSELAAGTHATGVVGTLAEG